MYILIRVMSVGWSNNETIPSEAKIFLPLLLLKHHYSLQCNHNLSWFKISHYIGQIRGGCVWVDRRLMQASHKSVPQCSCISQCSGKSVSSFRVMWHQGLSSWLLSTAAYLLGARAQPGRSTVWETKVISFFPSLCRARIERRFLEISMH